MTRRANRPTTTLLVRNCRKATLLARPFAGWLFVAACILAAGCSDGRTRTIEVTGRVTYGGGDWPKPGVLYFAPLEPIGNLPQRPGTAKFGTDGRFRARTFSDGDGLIPGRYRINIECWDTPPTMTNPTAAKSYIPSTFQTATANGLEVVVEPDATGPVEVAFDVPRS